MTVFRSRQVSTPQQQKKEITENSFSKIVVSRLSQKLGLTWAWVLHPIVLIEIVFNVVWKAYADVRRLLRVIYQQSLCRWLFNSFGNILLYSSWNCYPMGGGWNGRAFVSLFSAFWQGKVRRYQVVVEGNMKTWIVNDPENELEKNCT